MAKVKKNVFLTGRKSKKIKIPFARPAKISMPEPAWIIQGQSVGSKEEWWTSLALEKLGFEYEYQYPVFGGRSVRGGQMLDFLVYTPGKWTIVDVLGAYWHTGKNEDRLSIQKVVVEKKWRLVEAWDYLIPSAEKALSFYRAKLGTG
jgi:hypothetical protein